MNLLANNPHLPAWEAGARSVTPAQEVELRRLQQIWTLREEKYELLTGQGFVRLVDAMGSDDRVVEAARLTAQTEGKDFADDRTLLRYLMRHLHTTPLEFGEIVVHIRVPMDCWRQWVRHRTASINEYSTRYSEAIDAQCRTPPDAWRRQSESNRQGSSGNVVTDFPAGYSYDAGVNRVYGARDKDGRVVTEDRKAADQIGLTFPLHPHTDNAAGEFLSMREYLFQQQAQDLYEERLAFGVAKEVARKDLPLSTFTEAYWKIDVHNLLHFLALRMDSHAQQEIRDYATVIGEQLVAKLFPVTWEAFLDYRFHAMQLTRLDVEVIQRMVQGAGENAAEIAATTGFESDREAFTYMAPYSAWVFNNYQDPAWKSLKKCRERVECWAKLERLGLVKYKEGEEPIV